jgi:rSAM/selenodomain-associated transferase 2
MSPLSNKNITVIIPTLNEAESIQGLIHHLLKCKSKQLAEIIVVDANSTDNTYSLALQSGAKVIKSKEASRAHQMNMGAKDAIGDILYFVHADAYPPETFCQDIIRAVNKGSDFGCYRFKFNSRNPLLAVNSFFTRFKFLWCRGGDQTLFIDRDVFKIEGGFNEEYIIMEDFELIKRLWKKYSFSILPKSVSVSARKYKINGYFQVNLANLKVFRMFNKGYDPVILKQKYFELIKHPKDLD